MLTRNTLKKIKHSFGRFASLIAIILIGVGFYAGIRQSIPAIRDVQNKFTKNTNLMDIHLMSTLGFTDEDISELEKLKLVLIQLLIKRIRVLVLPETKESNWQKGITSILWMETIIWN